ncbi:hypothetical protein [Plantibacter sp. H53]|uniref:hypothetical protein n=1 Tax=Plantibacter sp. H53 TaxID=1827323 RepID=UPI0012FA26FC|nr:hypothetical protein [Plantibacter sp. H53]
MTDGFTSRAISFLRVFRSVSVGKPCDECSYAEGLHVRELEAVRIRIARKEHALRGFALFDVEHDPSTHLVRPEDDSWIAEPLPHPLGNVRVLTTRTIGDEHVIFRVPGTASGVDIAATVEVLHRLEVDQDDALLAYLTLPDVHAMQDDLMEGFHENFVGTYPDNEAALRALSPLTGWESSLADWCIHHGIEFDALNWNLDPLISRLAEVYDLIDLKGRVHAFIK